MTGSEPRFRSACSAQSVTWLRAERWEAFPGLVHGFSHRLPDRRPLTDPAAVGASLGVSEARLQTLHQVHGGTVVQVTDEPPVCTPSADGMLTAVPNVLLGIATADCVPVLLVVPERGVAGALHAGWRGTQQAICLRGVACCAELWDVRPDEIYAALGPAIDGCCYEVGSDVGEPLAARWGDDAAWRPHGDKGHLDLRAINRTQLMQAGVPAEHIQHVGGCTCCHGAEFASYRREGPDAARQLSIIGWSPAADVSA